MSELKDTQRRGPWSKTEKDFIAAHHDKKSAEEIAAILRRNKDVVADYIHEHFGSAFKETAKSAEYNIQLSPVWKELEQQFTKDELQLFLFHWGRIISQFRDDVYPTEELQVIDTIKLEILMSRSMKNQQKCVQDVLQAENLLQLEVQKGIAADSQVINSLRQQIASLRAAQDVLGKQHNEYLKQKNDILKNMKATRDARIQILESSKENFAGWMRKLISDKELRIKMGRDLEKMRLASLNSLEKFSEYHKYIDGDLDRPILNEHTVKDE